jgi:dTDP-4-amino-4,6-dideoxygalactose transaminase
MERPALLGGEPLRTRPFPSWPHSGEEESDALQEVLREGVWSDASGPRKRELERRFAEFHGAEHAVAVTNGTISLEIALKALGIGAGDEVIVPPYTFLATATAVLGVNALPVFADIDPETYCLSPDAVEAAITPRTRAVIPVHLGGHPADMDRFQEIREKHGIAVIEDAAHAHGAAWKDRKVGALGDAGCWSFQASKNMTAGEGGMFTTNDKDLAEKAWSLHHCGRMPEGAWYEHTVLGGNYRITEFQCAILLAQLARLPEQTARREENAAILDEESAKIEGLRPLKRDLRCTVHAHHLYLFRYDAEAFGGMSRDLFIQALCAEGIPASPGYTVPLDRQPVFAGRAFDTRATGYDPSHAPTRYGSLELPVCERACEETVWFTQNMLLGEEEDLADIVRAMRKVRQASGSLQTAAV